MTDWTNPLMTEDQNSRKASAKPATLDDALAIMRDVCARAMRGIARRHDSLRPYLNEEMHELDDAIRSADDVAMCSELGDVLLQVLFHAIIAEERGAFDVSGCGIAFVAKMTKRHPWLYGNSGGARAMGADEVEDGVPRLPRGCRRAASPCTARTGFRSARRASGSTGRT